MTDKDLVIRNQMSIGKLSLVEMHADRLADRIFLHYDGEAGSFPVSDIEALLVQYFRDRFDENP